MLRKTLLVTSALIVAGSMAFASPKGTPRPGHHTIAQIRQLQREALAKKGFILDKRGIPIAILRPPVSPGSRTAAVGEAVPLFTPGHHNSYSNFSKSKNALYITWFGWFAGDTAINSTFSGSFCYSYSGSTCINHYKYTDHISETVSDSVAAPFSGVESASSISLGISGGPGKVAIHENHVATSSNPCATPSGAPSCPGKRIKGASGTFSGTGSGFFPVATVSFNPVNLRKKARYWVVPDGDAGNRLVWGAEASNWTGLEPTADYKASIHEVINSTYGTTRYNNWYTYHTSFNSSTNGWVSTADMGPDWPGAFSINFVPP